MSISIKAILYTDGGYNQAIDGVDNSAIAGYGVHGYLYTNEPPKRGTGNAKVIPTDNGYEGPSDTRGGKIEGEKVTVIKYVDIVGGGRGHKSSGHVELCALIEALKWLDEQGDVVGAKIFSDSMFVVEAVTKYLPKWVSKNWVRQDGQPIKYLDEWKECHALLEKLNPRIEIETQWIKGHNGHIGNESADKLATRGKMLVDNAEEDTSPETRVLHNDPQGYWNPKGDAPRILQSPRWYFDTLDTNWLDDEGFRVFYCGTHGTRDKEPELPGKPYSDNFLSVVKTKQDVSATDQFREYALNHKNARYGRIVVGYLDTILSTKVFSELKQFGLDYFRKARANIYVRTSEKQLVLHEMNPQGQGYRMKRIWETLRKRLDELHQQSSNYQYTDITDHLYEAQGKKGLLKLKPSWTQRVKHMDVKVAVNLEKASDTPKVVEKKVRLILGQDILSRNQLAAIAEDVVSVQVVTWRESDEVARFGTYVVMSNGDHGLWTRYDANYILCN